MRDVAIDTVGSQIASDGIQVVCEPGDLAHDQTLTCLGL